MSVQEQIDRLLAQRAAEWFEIYRTGREDQYPAFIAWLSESPRHVQEFLEIAGRYAGVRDVLSSGVFDHRALLQKVAPQAQSLRGPTAVARGIERRPANMRWRIAAGVAVIAVAAAAVFGFWRHEAWQSFETQVGEQRVVQLLDGSVLTLNAQSQAKVRLTRSQRDVRLQRGEALFKVAADKSRPFLVHTAGATVRVIGTQFNVYARPDGSTTVAVLEGRVEVSGGQSIEHVPTAPAEKELLNGGEAAQVASTGKVQRELHANINSAVAWRQRRLVFDRTPLEDIVQEFNRYNRTLKFELIGVQPGSYHFTGSFDADDPRSLALLLSKEPLLSVDDRDKAIVIRRR